ncbi:uncharacterized protein LOC132758857 [Ruditapes philippinarum]|uniref:uncharacterized protein LOC132758857 n=1 Tax=Ruditapes philippinarum TaxID=129788 RepID=UPI00295B84D4|nr:uncharacterized protein LOC132758857 [Ruditapes philippinarum]
MVKDRHTVNIEENCGKSINSFAGELTSKFDLSKYNSKLVGGQCRVTVKLESSLFTSQSHVLFYFTKVNLFPSCNAGNITFLDGDKKKAIKGLPRFLCGHHKDLEQSDKFFTTLSDRLTVVVNTNDVFGASYYGQFNLKYIMFSNGPCHSEHVYKCSNGRCISNFYRCSSQINACLTTEAVCNGTKATKVNGTTEGKVRKDLQNLYVAGCVVILAMSVVCIFKRKYGLTCPSCQNRQPRLTNQGRGWGPINIQSNAAPDEQVPLPNRSLNEVNTIDTLTVDNSFPSEHVIFPNRYMLAITYPVHPPFYEDVEDNNDNNGDILPSYDDVVANPTEYTHVSQR